MSWSIPTKIEEDFISGKAQYRTFQTGSGGQSILPVPTNAYVVIFGYDFSPAGGGWRRNVIQPGAASTLNNEFLRYFETQQISFYTGTDFYPFIHHIDVESTLSPLTIDVSVPTNNVVTNYIRTEQANTTPIARQVYITSSHDITITHGLILNSPVASQNAIPATNRTPPLLSYGGSPQAINTQTDFGPAGTPVQFMQPSPKDYQDFGFGVLPNGASGQAFATPDITNGLRDASELWNFLGADFKNAAACQYFLSLHYALYTSIIPEQRG